MCVNACHILQQGFKHCRGKALFVSISLAIVAKQVLIQGGTFRIKMETDIEDRNPMEINLSVIDTCGAVAIFKITCITNVQSLNCTDKDQS